MSGATYSVCVDSKGRYHGAARATFQADGKTVDVRGSYERDAPAGTWTCSRGSERLTIQFNPLAFRDKLWGMQQPPDEIIQRRHLGPYPHVLCPAGDWREIARTGLKGPEEQDLQALGVATVTEYVAP